jgi:adhesin transport system outer membrane protein
MHDQLARGAHIKSTRDKPAMPVTVRIPPRRTRAATRWCVAAALCLPQLALAAAPLTLRALVDATLQTHPAVAAQRAQQDAAAAEVEAARWQFFPTPSVSVEKASASRNDLNYGGDSTVSTLRLQQPLWTGGRLTANKERAEAGVAVSLGALDETRQQLALRVVQVYSDWLAAHLKRQAGETSLATHERLRDQVARRIKEGVSADADLVLALGRLQAVNAELALARAQQDIALARLSQLTGEAVDDASLAPAAAEPLAVRGPLADLLRRAETRDPTTRRLEAQARRQEAVVKETRAALSPEVYVRAERQYGNYAIRGAAPDNRIFVGVSSQFGAGLSSLSAISGARAQYQAALAEVDAQHRAVGEQVMADWALATQSQARLQALQASLAAAGDVSHSYDRQFLAGRKSWLDVMNAARELAQTESQIADIRATLVVATWRLAILTQAGLSGQGSPQ